MRRTTTLVLGWILILLGLASVLLGRPEWLFAKPDPNATNASHSGSLFLNGFLIWLPSGVAWIVMLTGCILISWSCGMGRRRVWAGGCYVASLIMEVLPLAMLASVHPQQDHYYYIAAKPKGPVTFDLIAPGLLLAALTLSFIGPRTAIRPTRPST